MQNILNLIYEYGMIAMFFLILLEYACFPVSSEIVLPFSGAVASIQNISFFVILPLSVLAGILGTSICYVIGRLGGPLIINKITTRFPKSQKGIDNSYDKFEKYGAVAVCIGRVIPICRTYIAFVAGAVKQSYPTFFLSSTMGITIWNIILIGIGYLLRENWGLAKSYYQEYKIILLPILLLLVIYIIYKIKKAPKEESSNS
ncbi:alkaline phosphatase like protein [Lachnospiraceae bacterium KM106-2]|nr:alkaline phosphatase like protein [Lachnospiraceae bacterium KM106-2]